MQTTRRTTKTPTMRNRYVYTIVWKKPPITDDDFAEAARAAGLDPTKQPCKTNPYSSGPQSVQDALYIAFHQAREQWRRNHRPGSPRDHFTPVVFKYLAKLYYETFGGRPPARTSTQGRPRSGTIWTAFLLTRMAQGIEDAIFTPKCDIAFVGSVKALAAYDDKTIAKKLDKGWDDYVRENGLKRDPTPRST